MHPSACPHFDGDVAFHRPNLQNQFIKPSLPKGWICLQDGCIKKYCTRQELIEYYKKYQLPHSVFLNTITFQIFCLACNSEIDDVSYPEARRIRNLLIQTDPEQQKVLFGANMEYPESFQREKSGITGTVSGQINSFVSAVLQMLAHTSPFYSLAQETDLSTIRSPVLRLFFQKICMIQSGKYRVIDIKDLENCLLTQCKDFTPYGCRNPSNLQYQILRLFSHQFQYDGPACQNKKIIPKVKAQKINPVAVNQISYSPMKALFSGQFFWKAQCSQCKGIQIMQNTYECIRLQDIRPEQKKKIGIMDLIQSTFEQSQQNSPFYGRSCTNCKDLKKISLQLKLDQCKVTLPNILLLQFGSQIDGFNVNLPDELDLTKFVKEETKQPYLYEYVGCIGKVKRQYVTHARISRENTYKQYIFDNVLIKDDAKKPTLVKLAIYKLRPLLRNKNLSKNIQSSYQVNINCHVPLPDFWHLYVAELRNVQPLVSPFICPHGALRPAVQSKASVAYNIPPQIYEYLLQQFGGTAIKITEENQICKVCALRLEMVQKVKQSQKQMAIFADKLSNKKFKFCIDIEWLQKWKEYLYKQCDIPYNSAGYKRPGPIQNKRGLLQDGKIQQSLYKKISPQVWYFMRKFYGGGPLITKAIGQPSLAAVQAIDLRFQNIKQAIQMINIVNKY